MSESRTMATLTIAQAESLVADALTRCRTSAANAACVARALVAAEADGLKGHGLSRVPTYVAQAKVGKIDGFATPAVERRRPGAAVVDAANGFAFPAIEAALALLPGMARESGIASTAIRRSHHCGAAGHPVERLAELGLVGMMFANTPAAIAPWGGSKAVFGTNPIAFACPLPGRAPVVVDLALSKIARGNILAAKQTGERIPEGWALDTEGIPTTDPDAALAGTMLPLGDAKGTSLALMVELLAAGLTGANYAADASSFLDAEGPPPGTGQLIIAFDPAAFGGSIAYFAQLIGSIEAQQGARVPGSRRLAARQKAATDGLKIDDALVATIEGL
jgi:(2R)-3-sulfolactate dehydrogenase (NADP+)